MDSDPTIQAYKQWIHITVENKMASGDLKIQKAEVTWGKFYNFPNKDKEIAASEVNQEVAGSGSTASVAACGRSDASSGTEGSFDVYDGDVRVCHVYWDCPWGAGANKFQVTNINGKYIVQHTDAPDTGAIGEVTVKVVKTS